MVLIVFNFKYLCQNFIKLNLEGVFWNPQDDSKLSLGNQVDKE